ncbi:MAG: DUF4412 domain-containing protein [Bacteroidales bacterium]|nr:MAG: DUF4412 domain-containing protein [Bacteroidales bacterium]
MNHWPKILILLIVLPISALSNIDNFEGKIKIIKEGAYDTSKIEVSVKNEIVRIDEFNSSNQIVRSYLVDLAKKRLYALSLKEKLYSEIPLNKSSGSALNPEITKTQNSMNINGENCYQWRVKDKSRNSEVTFWVTQKDLSFLKALVGILNRSQTPLTILGQFPQVNGYIPLMAVDRTLLRKLKESARIVDIKQQKLPDSIFIIPRDFQELLG